MMGYPPALEPVPAVPAVPVVPSPAFPGDPSAAVGASDNSRRFSVTRLLELERPGAAPGAVVGDGGDVGVPSRHHSGQHSDGKAAVGGHRPPRCSVQSFP